MQIYFAFCCCACEMLTMNTPLTGAELKSYREAHNLNLDDVGKMLGGVTGPTISRWESGQEIPGPAQLLLRMLIHGEVPFKGDTVPPQIRDAMWELEMSLGTWEEINRRRLAGGYATVTDWIASLVREELHEQPTRSDFRTADQAPLEDVALLADLTPGDAAGGGDDVAEHAAAAAEAFAKNNPLPPAGAAGAPAGTTAGRKDVIYKRLPRTSGTGAKKR